MLDSYTKIATQPDHSQVWLPQLGSPAMGPITFKLLCGADLLGQIQRTEDTNHCYIDYNVTSF